MSDEYGKDVMENTEPSEKPDEFETAFNEMTSGKKTNEPDTDETLEDDKAAECKEDISDDGKEEKEEETAEKEEVPDYSFLDEGEKEEEKNVKVEGKKDAEPPKKEEAQTDTGMDIGALMAELPDKTVNFNGVDFNPKEFARDYKEETAFVGYLVSEMLKKIQPPAPSKQKLPDINFEEVKKDIDLIQQTRAELKQQRFMAEVKSKHPDMDEIIADSKFANWLKTQPKKIQQMARSNDVEEADYLLSMYKKNTTETKADAKIKKSSREALYKGSIKGVPGKVKSVGKSNMNPDEEYEDEFRKLTSQ